ncbi:MAG: DHA2 family efflux MFS transporter permease subunit [Nitrospiraceae bacterium]|nr:DHA2 family efflux MFS transporter permease subunit [Nitrospiraceae bacterium]
MEETNKWLIAVTVMAGTIMSALDTSIVNVALPYMKGNLGASVEEITWVATGYILSNVIIMPIIGMLSARFGRKRLYTASVALFTASSMLCGLSWSLSSLVFFRILQGAGGGALIPLAQAILREAFPPEEQGLAMGVYGFGVVLGPAFGPTIGGWLTDNYSWPWIFYINVPIGILNLVLISRFLHDPPYLKREKGKVDFPGLFFLVAGLGALQLLLEKGDQKDWFESSFIVYLAVISLAGLAFFIWRELTAGQPAVDLRILKNVPFTSGTSLGGVMGLGLYGSLFVLPLFLQQMLGYPALDSGLVLMPRSLAMAFAMPVSGRLYNRLGPRVLIGAGLIISAFSFWELSRMSLDVGFRDLFLPQFLQGTGFGMIFVALSTVALATVERQRMTAATGLYNVVRQVFGSIGIAIAATQLTRGDNIYRAALVKNLTPFSTVASYRAGVLAGAMAARGADPVTARHKALGIIDMELGRQAGMLSFDRVFYLIAVLFVLSVPLVFLLKEKGGAAGKEVVID